MYARFYLVDIKGNLLSIGNRGCMTQLTYFLCYFLEQSAYEVQRLRNVFVFGYDYWGGTGSSCLPSLGGYAIISATVLVCSAAEVPSPIAITQDFQGAAQTGAWHIQGYHGDVACHYVEHNIIHRPDSQIGYHQARWSHYGHTIREVTSCDIDAMLQPFNKQCSREVERSVTRRFLGYWPLRFHRTITRHVVPNRSITNR